ncbi:12024_t:CDS:2, partial [Dentiscutata erythropus]
MSTSSGEANLNKEIYEKIITQFFNALQPFSKPWKKRKPTKLHTSKE